MKKPITLAAWTLFTLAGACLHAADSAPQPYRIAPPASWVSPAEDPLQSGTEPVEEGESDYLLADYQIRVADISEGYVRVVERMVSQGSVDRSAQISVEVDPVHERVLLHDVHVVRNGRTIDKLADSRRSLLNREEDLEEGLINGRVTLHVILQDVRVGDVLDYSYTVERRDPFGERGFNGWYHTQWSSPVRRFRLRLLNLADRSLQVRDQGALGSPSVVHKGRWVETTWSGKDIAPLLAEDDRPAWFYYYPRIEVSEFADWNAVRAWARPMYAPTGKPKTELASLIADLKAEPDEAARIVRALRFVQDDIRYTGLEIGAGAYRPSQPGTVLARRYGDCKDKVFLLVTLLRALGVEAYPALVHSRMGVAVAERVPSPGAFDHVIAKVRFKDRDYWLDATASGQGGSLDTLVQADFALALVIDDSAQGLTKIPARDGKTPGVHVVETYDLREGRAATAKFGVKTVYREDDADSMRVKMRGNTASSLGKDYLDYYRKTHPGIRVKQPLTIKDDRAANVYTLEESYEIDSPFSKNEEDEWKFELEAYLVTDRTKPPGMAERNTPLARVFPMHVQHEINAYLHGEWEIDDNAVKVSDPAFEYRSEVKFSNGQLHLQYDLHNKADHVTAAAFKAFAKKLAKVHTDAYFTLTEGPLADKPVVHVEREPQRKSVSRELFLTMIIGLGIGLWVSRILMRLRLRVAPAEENAPRGFGGWMVLPVIGVVISPCYMAYNIWIWFQSIGQGDQLHSQTALIQSLMFSEFLLISALLVISLQVAWLLFRRYRAFPYAFILMQLLGVVALVLDNVTLHALGDAIPAKDGPEFGRMILRMFMSALWISYMLRSQRVRATFVKDWDEVEYPGARVVPAA